jgi:hypothetical protein
MKTLTDLGTAEESRNLAAPQLTLRTCLPSLARPVRLMVPAHTEPRAPVQLNGIDA